MGLESTVIDVTGPSVVLLRAGGMPVERLEEVIEEVKLVPDEAKKKRSPGTRYRHYAPLIPLLLWENGVLRHSPFVMGKRVGYIGINEPPFPVEEKILFKTPENYAQGLFLAFRTFEKKGVEVIVASGQIVRIGLALRDRLSCGEELKKNLPSVQPCYNVV